MEEGEGLQSHAFIPLQFVCVYFETNDFSSEAVVVEKSDSEDDGGAAQRALEEAGQTYAVNHIPAKSRQFTSNK